MADSLEHSCRDERTSFESKVFHSYWNGMNNNTVVLLLAPVKKVQVARGYVLIEDSYNTIH